MCSNSKNNEPHARRRRADEKSSAGRTEMDIQEWNMELRTNNICMDEHNADVRMKKIEGLEKCEAQRRHDRDKSVEERERNDNEKDRANIARERANEDREWTNN